MLPHKETQRDSNVCFQIVQLLKVMPWQMLKLSTIFNLTLPCTARNNLIMKFDESTNKLGNRQYDRYVQYWSESDYIFLNRYCDSLFLGHCNSDDLVDHFKQFVVDNELDPNYLLFTMDEPNVNLVSHEKLSKHLRDNLAKSFLNLGTCSLHPMHTAFCQGITSISFDLDLFFMDIHFSFQLSSS